ncbi:MAG: hypothetical protein NTW38_02130 [Candidatus Aminicenantes bacterium]|nr:hypothetical protein [Candidatus Aminicenantes bacterium]
MSKKRRVILLVPAAALILSVVPLQAREMNGGVPQTAVQITEWKKSAPRVYLDFGDGDADFIRTEIPFVNYVRDRLEADVHVLVTTQVTGSGGTEFTMAFIGRGDYASVSGNLVYASAKTDTEDEIRKGYVSVLKMGLIPYVARTPIRDLLTIEYKEKIQPTDVVDPWKFWVFSLSVGGELHHESQAKSQMLWFNASANKITPDLKIRLGLSTFFARDEFQYDEKLIESDSREFNLAGLFTKSLGEHWSAGIYVSAGSSTYGNLLSKISPAPVVEYNIFPYSESTRRQLRLMYKVGFDFVRYREETIYDKTKENLLGEALSATAAIKEPWGTLEASLEGSHFFHDRKKNRLEFNAEAAVRILKGLDFLVDLHYERVRDQLSLAKGDRSLAEILLRRKELATDYNLGLEVGLSYTFGSIFSNVVNPRFGDLGNLDISYD